MTDNSFNNWHAMSDKALEKMIGSFIKHHRIKQNKTQRDLATEAGISRSTLSLLERGQTVTLSTFIKVMRLLDQLHIFDFFNIQQSLSPLALAKLEQAKRKRVRTKSAQSKTPILKHL